MYVTLTQVGPTRSPVHDARICNSGTLDINAAIKEIDQLLEDLETTKALKERFFGSHGAENSNEGFPDALAIMFTTYQSVGMEEGGVIGARSFCEWISKDPVTI